MGYDELKLNCCVSVMIAFQGIPIMVFNGHNHVCVCLTHATIK